MSLPTLPARQQLVHKLLRGGRRRDRGRDVAEEMGAHRLPHIFKELGRVARAARIVDEPEGRKD